MSAKITISAKLRWPDVKDDYVLEFDGHSIGRVRLDGTRWIWSIIIPMALPEWAEGTAANRDESFKTLAAAWRRLLAQTDPGRLQRAWDMEKAFEARQRRTAAAKPDQVQT
ncbi:hypothetical protein [uncultured Bradyrhizobium sp.]|uniref:hypothetical protein n=1 Tax=uncultured Bradyrhizobium sp. TaxID=199684 RepID=UPI0035CA4C15